MARKAKTAATPATKSTALKESFAEIKKADAAVKAAETKAVETKAAETEKVAETTKTTAEEKAPEKKEAAKKPAAHKPAAKAEKTVKAEKTEKAEKAAVKTSVTLEFNGKQIKVQEILDKAVAAAEKAKKDAKQIDVYVVANQNAAYYVIDGEGRDDYRVNF